MQQATENSLFGIDVSEFQSPPTTSEEIDWVEVRKAVDFAWLRASSSSTGTFNADAKFEENATACRAQGIPAGAYHFARVTGILADAESQADQFIARIEAGFGSGDYGDLFPVIDLESNPDNVDTDTYLEWAEHFIEYFREQTGRLMKIYTANFFINELDDFEHSTRGHILSKYPLWIANTVDDPPPDGGGWTEWRAWQFSHDGSVGGIEGPVDLNHGPDDIDFLTLPRDVSNFRGKPDRNSVTLTWDENTDADLKGYNIFFQGTKFIPKNGDNFIIFTGLQNGVPHTFEIRSLDEDDQESLSNASVTVTPQENLLRLRWIPKDENLDPIDFGDQVGPYIIREFEGEGQNFTTEQTQKAPFQIGNSLFNVDVESRILTLNVRSHARNRAEMFERRSELTRAFAFEPSLIIDPLELFETGTIQYFKQTFDGEEIVELDAIPRESPQFSHVRGHNSAFDADIEFFCPYPFWISETENIQRFPDGTGFSFPTEFPIEFGQLSGTLDLENEGAVSAPVIIEIEGELANPRITNDTTGAVIQLNTNIPQYEKIVIFTDFGKKRIIRVKEDGTEENAIGTLDFDVSTLNFVLERGTNQITVSSDNVNGQFFVKWRHRFVGV